MSDWVMAKYIIWLKNKPVSTGCMNGERTINDWLYRKIESITGDSKVAIEVASWGELAVLGDVYLLDEYDLKITVSEVD